MKSNIHRVVSLQLLKCKNSNWICSSHEAFNITEGHSQLFPYLCHVVLTYGLPTFPWIHNVTDERIRTSPKFHVIEDNNYVI